MPLEIGNTWTYQITSGLTKRVDEIKVTARTAVGQNEGYILTSPIGTTTLAWQGNTLVAGKFANTEFFPPLPIYAPLKEGEKLSWKGIIRTAGVSKNGSANLISKSVKEEIDGKEITVQFASLSIDDLSALSTWFRPGKGIFRQEHRSNDQLITRIQYVSGP